MNAVQKIRIAWVSRHPILDAQKEDLSRILAGYEYEIMFFPDKISGAEALYRTLRSYGIDIAVVVAPLSVLQRFLKICNGDILTLYADMHLLHICNRDCGEFNPTTDVYMPLKYVSQRKYRHLRFAKFVKIDRVEVVTSDITDEDVKRVVKRDEMRQVRG